MSADYNRVQNVHKWLLRKYINVMTFYCEVFFWNLKEILQTMWMQIIFIYFITKNDKTLNKDCSFLTDFKQVHLLVFFWPFYLHLLFFISLFQTIVYFPVMSFVICLFFKCQTHIKDTPFACFYTFFWCKVWCGLHHSAWYGIPRWNW